MVITCPHALGLAVPLVIAISTGLAAGHGLLIRNRAAFEAARLIDAVVFDKTGTLTLGEFGVQAVVPLASLDETELLRLAASVESGSEHPIAGGIIHETEKRGISYEQARDFQAIKGRGASGVVGGRTVVIASPGYLDEKSIPYDKGAFNAHLGQGRTVVFVLLENKPVGAIALGDTIRTESKAAVSTLKSMGIKTIMLTGDNRGVAEAVSNALGLDEFYAEVLPDGKAGKIRDLMAKGYRVAMAGDGINDAPALATAQLGIAIGAGTAVAIETADIVLVRSNPLDIVAVLKLARATYRKMIQNLAWATGYNVVAIPLAAGVLAWAGITLSPAAGAVLMSASTIIVAINARFLSAVDQGKA
jgi:Cu2+-exporting ATPase